jgi:3-deoxy-D-manno-octulosonic-acid transferase
MFAGMIWLYRLLFLPALFFLLPRYLLRMLRRGGYAKDFAHRFGVFKRLPAKRPGVRRIWLQAVSVGEVNAVEPLLRELAARGDTEVVLTTTTSTGYEIARKKLAPLALATGVFPVDFWLFSRLAWKRIQPDFVVLMEGELWPEHLQQARERKVPVALINARLSDKTYSRYFRFKWVARELFSGLSIIGVGAREDARRFAHLDVPIGKIRLTGNLKFEAGAGSSPGLTPEEATALRESLGFSGEPGVPVLLGSSTWPGEEAMLLEVFRQARRRNSPLRLLLVPRHAERRDAIAALLEKTEWKWFLRSKHLLAPHPADVCVADTTGELSRLTALATLAFIGKSLPPNKGGQTPIECAALGIPMVYGPCMSNFRDACRGLEVDLGAIRVNHAGEATLALLDLLASPEKREVLAGNARRWHTANRGATVATLQLLDELPGWNSGRKLP